MQYIQSYMSEKYVQQITLDCFMNKEQREKEKSKGLEEEKKTMTKDTKFYKKRIVQITKDMLNNTPPQELLHDVSFTFHNYIKTCIRYFKIIDKHDILQEDYKDFNILEGMKLQNLDVSSNEIDYLDTNRDKLMMRSIKVKKPNLDTFVIKTQKKSSEEPVLPKKKKVNLKDPQFKTKGVQEKKGKKENIDSIHENEKNN